ncbi:MAG: hypothetical protein ACJAS1_003485 [Oleiphilaceae bacterium]|jgi:hypothetical protein
MPKNHSNSEGKYQMCIVCGFSELKGADTALNQAVGVFLFLALD